MPDHSRFLTVFLRYRRDIIGIKLGKAYWPEISLLLHAMNRHGKRMSQSDIVDIVSADPKQRITSSLDRKRLRAFQGHSFQLDFGLPPAILPVKPYHGKARHSLDAIFAHGLLPGRRQFVHLRRDAAGAAKVGARHGKAVILTVNCADMAVDGHLFYRADNAVWMTSAVPARFLGFAAR